MVNERDWPKPAAWAITQDERLWQEYDAVAERSFVVEWSLADNYRTQAMQPGDRALFWITGANGGLARVSFVLDKRATPRGYWRDAHGVRHESPYQGVFFLPPFPNHRFVHRSAFVDRPGMQSCELLGTAAQTQPPLRVESKEWTVIKRQLLRFDRSNSAFRAAWHG